MNTQSALAGGPVQIAYGVTDVDAAARQWSQRFGAGPFFVRHHIAVSDAIINGSPSTFDHSSAFGQWGSLMVELVQVHGPAELVTRDAELHHLAYFVDSFDAAAAELTERGWPAILTATAGTVRFAFHDARTDVGHLIEIYQHDPRLRRFYAMVSEAAADWDGTDPVRVLG